MRNIYLLMMAALFIFSSSGLVLGAGSGNPNDVESPRGPGFYNFEGSGIGAFKTSGEVEFVFKKELKGRSETSDIKEKNGTWYLGKISYTVIKKLDIFAILGASYTEFEWKENNHEIKVNADPDFAWGGGARLSLFEVPQWGIRLTANGLFRSSEPDIKKIEHDRVDVAGSATAKKIEIIEWQAGGSLSKEYRLSSKSVPQAAEIFFIPYVGVRYSDSCTKVKYSYQNIEYDTGSAENDCKIGMSAGADLLVGNNLSFNAEGRFLDETAVSGGLTLKY